MKDYSYLHQRLDPLGWTPERNTFVTPSWRATKAGMEPIPEGEHGHRIYTHQLFDVDDQGNLVIHYYRITGAPATYRRGDGPARTYTVTRFRTPVIGKDGEPVRFKGPSGTSPLPWFGPRLIEAYRESTAIDTLVITEGPIKAFAGDVAGAYILGVPGITQVRDEDKALDQFHSDVVDLIQRCRPKKVVWLMDGDCRHFPQGWDPETEEGREKDLFKKPNNFYAAIRTVRDLLQDLANEQGFSVWFKHVASDELPRHPKGLDDLLVDVANDPELSADGRAEALQAVMKELHATSGANRYFYRKSMDRMAEIKRYFAIGSAHEFYAAHEDRLKQHTWVFNGTKWQHDGKELVVVLPAVMRSYVRVGDTYYERVPIPNRFGVPEEKMHRRDKSTIVDDHGKEMVKRIQKLKAFCNVPSHTDYQPVMHNCWNRYQPFEHQPEPGDWPTIEKFMRHIFGTGTVEVPHPKKKGDDGLPVTITVNELDLGYDYMQLLYLRPTQMLPILCLVSKENETGKSTLGKLLKAIYTGNAAFVSSQDLQSDFNEHWISKLVVIIEEAFIEKKATIERIKDLATASVAMINSKGIQQQEIEVFLHFLICSNNVRNFVTATNDDIRYWVRNVPVIPPGEKDPHMLKRMYEEIPAFLHFLGKRSMATEELSRMWFYPPLLETEALRLVRESSQPVVRRQLDGWLRMMFLATRHDEILMTAGDIKREVFKGQNYDVDYINRIVKEDMRTDRWRDHKGVARTRAYSYWRIVERRESTGYGVEQVAEEVKVKQSARPFHFKREDFFSDAEWEMLKPDPAVMAGNQLRGTLGPQAEPVAAGDDEEDLPF